MERCPTCAGPVEKECAGCGPGPSCFCGTCGPKWKYRALPDTLEGIEAEGQRQAETYQAADGWYGIAKAREQALTRLFNGCATCGWEAQVIHPDELLRLHGQFLLEGQRQAYQQAVELASHRVGIVHPAYKQLTTLAADLRKLAEGE